MKPKIIEAWSGPGKKDETITKFLPQYDSIHIDMDKKHNAEWWYFDARLDSGYFVVAFFRAKHERTGNTGVEITIYKPNGEKIQKVFGYSRSEFKYNRENANLSIGKNYIKVDYANGALPTYEIFLDEGALGLHLTFKAQVNGWMPGKGYTQFGDKGHFGWCVALPRAEVTGTIKVDDKTLSVKGIGYHDHNWISFNLVMFVEYWYWGRIYSENFTFIYAIIKCNKRADDYVIKVLMLARQEKVLLSTGEYDLVQEDLTFHEKANSRYPKILKFQIPEKMNILMEVQEIVDADNLLFELNPILRFIVKRVLKLKPGYFRLNSKFTLEFTHEGKAYKEQGNCLHEMVKAK